MVNEFILKYINFAKSIDAANKIVAVITNDYNLNIIDDFIKKQDDYKKSVDNMVAYLKDISGISPEQKKDIKALRKVIEKTKDKLEKSSDKPYNMLRHYAVEASKRKIDFLIVFKNGDVWNVNFTASLRGDRLDTHSYRFSNSAATENYLIVCSYPYQDDQSKQCINNIKKNNNFGNVNFKVVCFEEFLDKIMFNMYRYKIDKTKPEGISPLKSEGYLSSINGKRGPKIEEMYAEVLNNTKNFSLYSNKIDPVKREKKDGAFFPNHYEIIIERLLTDLGVAASQVSSIHAEPIGALREKADVWVQIELKDGTLHEKGISIKSSSEGAVSVHEKHANDFIEALNIVDDGVVQALNEFEEERALIRLSKKSNNTLKKYFADKDHVYALLKWAIVGAEKDQHKADYVMLHSYSYNDKKALGHGIRIVTCEDYIDKLMQSKKEGHFGSYLSWTYKNNIQLKAPFIFE